MQRKHSDRQLVCFGEIMMRLAPENFLRFGQEERFEATFGGAEANVAICAANFGLDTAFVTKLPDNAIADACIRTVQSFGVNCDGIVRGGERMGIYYCEKGVSMRPTRVIYDRKHSAISEAKREEFQWDTIFDGAAWFHWTGITPALSASCAELSLDACIAAKAHGLTVSCDLNYRSLLWTKEEARAVMEKLVPYTDIIITNIEQVDDVFGIHPAEKVTNDDTVDEAAYRSVSRQMKAKFGCRYYAYTTRKTLSASDNITGALLYDAETDTFYHAPDYTIRIVDRVGGGDAFAGAMITCMMNGMDLQTTVNYAGAAAALKHTVEGDYSRMTFAEVASLANGKMNGRVQR